MRGTVRGVLAMLVAAGGCDHATPAATPDAMVGVDGAVVGAWTAEPPCTDRIESIYTALPEAAQVRGSVARCALGDRLEPAATQAALEEAGAELAPTTGTRVVRLAYRTVRSDGAAALSTATVYLPLVPRAVPAPVVLVGRPTAGIADPCAPSLDALPETTLALPLAARGFVTIAPDFAGLGNAGTHAYLDNHEAVAQLFDAARAVQQLVPGNVVGDPVAAIGYSQGGGVVLSAQALEYSETGKRTLRAVAAIAPEWAISTRSFGYEDVLREPDRFTGLAGLAPPTVTVLRHYGYFTNKRGAAHGGDAFPATHRASIVDSIESLCTVALGGALGSQQRRLGDLVDPTFRAAMLACIDGATGCAGDAAAFHQWLTSDFVTADPHGAPVLVVQGLADQVMPAAGEAACDVAKLRAEGVTPAVCVDAIATHDTILERKIEHVVAWVEARADGLDAPVCEQTELPRCTR